MSLFHFKYFSIKQEVAAVKVGTDAMLLGAFVDVTDASNCLEIGTGTGVIALMLAQQKSNLQVVSLEIDKETAEEAEYNVLNSSFSSQIQVQSTDFLVYQSQKSFDLIVSNPPYFENGLLPEDSKLKTAKHIDSKVVQLWFDKIEQLLSSNGCCWMILPFNSLSEWVAMATNSNLFLNTEIRLYAKPKVIKRVIVCFSKEKKEFSSQDFLIRNEEGNFSAAYIDRTKEFHNRVPLK
jgi:tRNA1Val (adenine37-N6)-methyltransferase